MELQRRRPPRWLTDDVWQEGAPHASAENAAESEEQLGSGRKRSEQEQRRLGGELQAGEQQCQICIADFEAALGRWEVPRWERQHGRFSRLDQHSHDGVEPLTLTRNPNIDLRI